ncbi:DNA-binding transcriptional regulator, MerR family [Oceanobacillus limi]|uniref:DNA-binding transcriptional regulator, MerR family n=1 Tax=Oceanobacillus limi TaxID=930131 RepID=A0A1I0G1Y1_9BACI|nr:MerR family transcriptional regulator [Oceanobacillus limi]SET64684.1 DNA-binding transcriptional regulator, MerR family [Oceanobacillus limi]
MRIGEFIQVVHSTKDTVRHYEELGLIVPKRDSSYRSYQQKDVQDFQAIKEMQSLGLTLKEVQTFFEMKRTNGCGSDQLLQGVKLKLEKKRLEIQEQEKELKNKRLQVEGLISSLDRL